jgi:MFS family permease
MTAAPAAVPAPQGRRSFRALWLGQLVSTLGDELSIVAIPLLLLRVDALLRQLGFVAGSAALGSGLACLVAGHVVDSFDRRWIMLTCDWVRAAGFGCIAVLWTLGLPNPAVLYVISAVAGAASMFFRIAYSTVIADLVVHDELERANGRLESSLALSALLGPALGGWLCHQIGPALTIGLDAASFAFSAVALRWLSVPPRVRTPQGNWLTGLRDGARFAFRHPLLRATIVLMALIHLSFAAVADLFVFHMKRELHQSDTAVGVVYSVAALGGIAGSLATHGIARRFGFGAACLGGIVLQGAAILGAVLAPPALAQVALAFVAFGFGMSLRTVATASMRQRVTPPALLGRVTAVWWFLGTSFSAIGAAVGTSLGERVGTLRVLGGVGALVTAIALLAVFSPIGERRLSDRPREWRTANPSPDRGGASADRPRA